MALHIVKGARRTESELANFVAVLRKAAPSLVCPICATMEFDVNEGPVSLGDFWEITCQRCRHTMFFKPQVSEAAPSSKIIKP